MDFRERDAAPQAAGRAAVPQGRRKNVDWGTRSVRIELFILLLGCALLLAAVSLFLGISSNTARTESKLVDSKKFQAIFLNGGVTSGSVLYSTYFGHITSLNDQYVVLQNVYYLTTDNTTQANGQATPQLTKLGCQQLHSPYDQMVINRSQVAFWENLQDNGKVVQAIQQYVKQNPNGPNCTATSNSTSSTPTNTQSGASTQSTTSNTTTKKP